MRARFELVGAILRAQQRDVRYWKINSTTIAPEQHRQAEVHVGNGEDRRERACGELAGEQRDEIRAPGVESERPSSMRTSSPIKTKLSPMAR